MCGWYTHNTVRPCDRSHAKYWSHDLLGRKYSPVIYLCAPSSGGYRWGGEERGSSLTAWSCNPVSEEYDNTNGKRNRHCDTHPRYCERHPTYALSLKQQALLSQTCSFVRITLHSTLCMYCVCDHCGLKTSTSIVIHPVHHPRQGVLRGRRGRGQGHTILWGNQSNGGVHHPWNSSNCTTVKVCTVFQVLVYKSTDTLLAWSESENPFNSHILQCTAAHLVHPDIALLRQVALSGHSATKEVLQRPAYTVQEHTTHHLWVEPGGRSAYTTDWLPLQEAAQPCFKLSLL